MPSSDPVAANAYHAPLMSSLARDAMRCEQGSRAGGGERGGAAQLNVDVALDVIYSCPNFFTVAGLTDRLSEKSSS